MAAPPMEVRFGVEHGPDPVDLLLELPAESGVATPPELLLIAEDAARSLHARGETMHGSWQYRFRTEPAGPTAPDDELRFRGEYEAAGEPRRVDVVVRRTGSLISTALIEHRPDRQPGLGRRPARALGAQTHAALAWYARGRYRELRGLKRFTSGLSGSDVFVFRPRLADPPDSADLPELSWGALLVKTGRADHLHLLGRGDGRQGLLYRLMALPDRFSLTHGNLHPRNVLVGSDDTGYESGAGHLELYFPNPDRRARLTDVILQHHAHQQWEPGIPSRGRPCLHRWGERGPSGIFQMLRWNIWHTTESPKVPRSPRTSSTCSSTDSRMLRLRGAPRPRSRWLGLRRSTGLYYGAIPSSNEFFLFE